MATMKTEIFSRVMTFWACGIDSHRHTSEATALACEGKQENSKRKTNTWTPDLLLKVLARKEAGESMAELGKDFGITRQRMSDVIRRAERLRKRTIDKPAKTVA